MYIYTMLLKKLNQHKAAFSNKAHRESAVITLHNLNMRH